MLAISLALMAAVSGWAPHTLPAPVGKSPADPLRQQLNRSPPSDARCASLRMESAAPPVDRAVSAAVYLLPVLDGFGFGLYVYRTVPGLGDAAFAVLPLVNAFQSLPFAGLILFIGLSTFTRNQGLSRFVRFNIQQALLLDIVLIIPSFFSGFTRSLPPDLAVMGSNFVFYFWVLVVGYSWFNIAQGKTPNEVPVISEAADMQIGPF